MWRNFNEMLRYDKVFVYISERLNRRNITRVFRIWNVIIYEILL